jgi:hypothetical protein
MGIKVSVKTTRIDDIGPHVARAMQQGGAEVILPRAVALAPREPDPKHDVHGADTGFVQVEPISGGYRLIVGFTAFWMRIQAQHPEWHHPHGGVSDFLLRAALEGEQELWSLVASATWESLAAAA